MRIHCVRSAMRTVAISGGRVPDFLDVAKMAIDPELDHHVHQGCQQPPDVLAAHLPPRFVLLDEQYELLKSQFRRGSMDAGDGSGMPRVYVAQIIECFFGAQFRPKGSGPASSADRPRAAASESPGCGPGHTLL